VALNGSVDQPFFSAQGQINLINGEDDVQVFEYSSLEPGDSTKFEDIHEMPSQLLPDVMVAANINVNFIQQNYTCSNISNQFLMLNMEPGSYLRR